MLYHVTPAVNLGTITRDGLVPAIGERSQACGETAPRVYLFTSQEACEQALLGWLGDVFDDAPEDSLSILEIDPTGVCGDGETTYELACLQAIPADMITRVLDENFKPVDIVAIN